MGEGMAWALHARGHPAPWDKGTGFGEEVCPSTAYELVLLAVLLRKAPRPGSCRGMLALPGWLV